jgi:hypothetical protein
MTHVERFLAYVLVASVLIFGCGGDNKGTSPSKGRKNFIKFENKWFYGGEQNRLRVIIDVCHQDFSLKPGEEKIVECVPEDGSTQFLVAIEGGVIGISYTGGSIVRKEVLVSGGQTVTISGLVSTFYVDVHD